MTTSYKAHSYRVSKEQCDLAYSKVKDFDQATQNLYIYIIFCTIINLKKNQGWTPICSKFIDKHFKGAKWADLTEAGLIEVTGFSRSNKTSREFRGKLNIVQEFQSFSYNSIDDLINAEWYNLFTKKRMNKVQRNKLTDSKGKSIPQLPRAAMETISFCVVNLQAMKDSLKEEFEGLLVDGASEEVILRHAHDAYCIREIEKRIIEDLGNGLVKYEPSHEMQGPGRIGEVGGVQGISRERKAAGFLNVPGVKNYDLKSSQVWGAIQWFEEAQLDTTWLTTYLKEDKQVYADRVEVDKDCWKGILCSILMGGFPPHIGEKTEFEDLLDSKMIRKHVCKYVGVKIEWDSIRQERQVIITDKQEKQVFQIVRNIWEVCGDLIKEMKKWHTWLVEVHIKRPGVIAYGNKQQYCMNSCGVTFPVHEYKNSKGEWINKNELKRKLAAFFLQGTEAAFIHHLTWVSDHYGYRVYSNQHDGVVLWIEGEVPDEAIEHARRESGLRYAFLEEKDFT